MRDLQNVSFSNVSTYDFIISYIFLSQKTKRKCLKVLSQQNSPIPWPDVPLNLHWKLHISQIQSGPQIWLGRHKLAQLTPNFHVQCLNLCKFFEMTSHKSWEQYCIFLFWWKYVHLLSLALLPYRLAAHKTNIWIKWGGHWMVLASIHCITLLKYNK